MKKIIFILTIAGLILSACSNESTNAKDAKANHEKNDGHEHGSHDHGDHNHDNGTSKEKRDIQSTDNKNAATGQILENYFSIKNALVSDDKSAAAEGGKQLLSAFEAFDMTTLSKEQHTEYMDILEDAKEQTEHIVKSPIDHQREHFEVLSVDIKDLIALVGTDKKLYEDFCPMANDGKGAIWISEFESIKNPFFGSKMLSCGKIQDRINQ